MIMAPPGSFTEAVKAWLAAQAGLRRAVIARRGRRAYKRHAGSNGVIWRDTGEQGSMKILVHVGLHRAASTSLQNWFESNRNKLAGARQFLFSDLSSGKQGSLFGALVGKTLIGTGPKAAAWLVGEELDRLAADYDGGVLSDENLLGLLPGQGTPAFAATERLAEVFEFLSRKHEVVPVVILREHIAWLVSLYRIAQLRGDCRPFSTFASRALPEDRGFSPMLRRLAQAVTPAAPIITTLDAIAADGGCAFLRVIAGKLGIDLDKQPVMARMNVTPPALVCALRQETARRGGFLVLEKQPELHQLMARLAARPEARTTAAMAAAARLIGACAVRVQPRLPYRLRSARAAAKLSSAPENARFLTLRQANEILVDAFAATATPLATPSDVAELRNRFVGDRAWIAEHYAPQWKNHQEV